MAAKTINQYLC